MSSTYLVRSLTPHAGLIFALRCLGLALQMIILAVDLERRFLERITLTSLLGETVRLTAWGLIASIRLRVLVFLVLIFDITLARAFIELVFLILVFTVLVFVFLILVLVSLLFVLLATGSTLIYVLRGTFHYCYLRDNFLAVLGRPFTVDNNLLRINIVIWHNALRTFKIPAPSLSFFVANFRAWRGWKLPGKAIVPKSIVALPITASFFFLIFSCSYIHI